ncbi:hypothetical protein [Streptomyces sp. KR55]|uniref:hypothetical protein n=1 Tax=Streptomyces sp. KR55 TaxID=3457425 RepID=UPI003FD6828D
MLTGGLVAPDANALQNLYRYTYEPGEMRASGFSVHPLLLPLINDLADGDEQ